MWPDDPRAHLAKDWFLRARRDLASGERLLVEPGFPVEAAFHVQQAAEKALKALLAWHNVPFARTHDLDDLLGQCATVAPDVLVFRSVIAPLTRYGVEIRYPGSNADPSADEVAAAMELARRVVQFVQAHLAPGTAQ